MSTTPIRIAIVALLLGCRTPEAAQAPGPLRPPVVYTFALPALPDSALKLAQYALAEIDGQVQLPQLRSKYMSVSTHYIRNRRGGGQTQVAIIAGLERQVADSSTPLTLV